MGDFLRVSQLAVLAAVETGRNLRVSQIAVEVLCSQPPGNNLRVSQIAVEVLCSPPVFAYSVSATTSFAMHGTATESASVFLFVSASTSFGLSSSSKGYVPGDKFVLAVTGLGIAGSGGGEGRSPGNVECAASHSITLSGTAAAKVAFVRRVSATTSIFISSVAYTPSDRLVSASTTILLSTVPVGRSSAIYVSALSGIRLSGKGSESAILFLNVSATTSFVLSDSLTRVVRGNRFVSALTGLGLSSLSSSTKSIVASVSGVTRVSISSSSSEAAEIGASAATSLAILVSGKQCRDIHASATLSLGIGSSTLTTNLKDVDAESSFTLTVSASVELTGTEARSDLVLLDLAQAVVWIPWRRSGLSLDPGGNLPHS